MPVLFVGHGSPMNAIADSEFSRAWGEVGSSLPTPRAVLCVSAHWETAGVRVTATEQPPTIHDFRGFPAALSAFAYPAPGSPALAQRVRELLTDQDIRSDHERGLDHGAWSVLCRLFPRADVPVVQLSLDLTRDPAWHFALGAALKPLRDEGVLVIGSGNIVHNLHTLIWQESAFDWAVEFDSAIRERILARDFESVILYETLAPAAHEAVPTGEHFLPLLYVLGMADPQDQLEFFCDRVTLGSISMRSVKVG
jgi:4,5-DOPA dioxygenase extradiol